MTPQWQRVRSADCSLTEHSVRLRFDRFEIDEADARLTNAGKPVALRPRPFAVLCALARTPRTLVTKNNLLDTVWGQRSVTESVLKAAISELRAVLGDDSKRPRYIETVSRRGYRFIAPLDAPEAQPGGAGPAPQPASSWMVVRSQELERLRAAWRLALSGRRQTLWIAGEAGVGKTMLIEHFVAQVGETHCAGGQCVEQYGAAEPFMPVLEALTVLCRRDAALVELIRAVAPTWLAQLPWLRTPAEREALRRELNGSGQARMLREMGELLDRYTENRPLLLVTEDLHRADPATVQLIDYMARRRGRAQLLWLGSFRPTEIRGWRSETLGYRPQLLVLEGRVADALGEPDRARESLRQAVAEARAREAPWLKLIALSALCERGGGSAEDRAALRHVVDEITREA